MAKPFKGAEKSVDVMSFVRTRTFTIAIFFFISAIFIMTIVLNTKIIQVIDTSGIRNVFTLRAEPQTILDQCGIKLNSDDTINFTGFKNNYGQIKINRAFPVVITADQKTQNVYISRGTVNDALIKAGVTVGSDDIINKPLATPVSKGLNVQIKRVTFKVVQKNQVLNCKLVEQKTPLLNKGKTKVVNPGTNGQFTITMQLRYVDGSVEKTDVLKQEVTKKPTDGKVLVGTSTKTPVLKLDVRGQVLTDRGDPVRYSKCLTGAATAYYAKPGSGTASGKKVAVGNIAVDPKLIPYGTRLYIVSSDGSFVYGNAVAADTGGFTTNGSGILADLYFNTKAECNMFGKRNIKIFVLE